MEVFIYVMRMFMLISSLRLVGYKYLDPIFVSICGLMQAISQVFKSMKGKKKFYKLSIEDLNSTRGSTPKMNTIVLTEQEFERRERAFSNLIQSKHPANHQKTEFNEANGNEKQPKTPNNEGVRLGDSGSGEDNDNNIEIEEKLIDDVYDMNAVKPNYDLRSLRKNWHINYMDLMEFRYLNK